jgi:hypothetical protein
MAVQDGRALIGKAWKDLMSRWFETKSQWNDAMSVGFEKNRLEPMEADLRSAASAMDHMTQLLNQVRRDCQ